LVKSQISTLLLSGLAVPLEFGMRVGSRQLKAEVAFTPANAAIGSETGRGIYPAGT